MNEALKQDLSIMMYIYESGAKISMVLIFVGCWIYCAATYGFLLGFGIGWLPSIIAAFLLGWLWPLIAAGGIFVLLQL